MRSKSLALEYFVIIFLLAVFAFTGYLVVALDALHLQPVHFLIFWGSVLATFLSTVMAEDFSDRIRKGAFGALAAGVLTTLVTIVEKDSNLVYLCYSFFGSMYGAYLGFMLYVMIAIMVYFRYGKIFALIELVTNGIGKFRDQIIAIENGEASSKLGVWFAHFSAKIYETVTRNERENPCRNDLKWKEAFYTDTITFILMSVVELCNLIFGTHRFRATIIEFKCEKGDPGDATNVKTKPGNHRVELWYFPAGKEFRQAEFGPETVAYKMATMETKEDSKTYDADSKMPSRQAPDRYKTFVLYRVNQTNVLSIDWYESDRDEGAKTKLEELEQLMKWYLISLIADLLAKLDDVKLELHKGS